MTTQPPKRSTPGTGTPSALSLAYERALRRRMLRDLFREFTARVQAAERDYEAIRATIRRIPDLPSLANLSAEEARLHMERIRAYHTRRFATQMRLAFGVDVNPFIPGTALEPYMAQAVVDNVALIKTIPERLHTSLTRGITRLQVAGPFDQQALQRLLRDSYGSSGYNLRRLTRDQTSKAIGSFNETRQQALGITEYVWSTSQDERVRETHVSKHGLTFRWASPPSDTGHPGNDVQCRCTANPIVPVRARR